LFFVGIVVIYSTSYQQLPNGASTSQSISSYGIGIQPLDVVCTMGAFGIIGVRDAASQAIWMYLIHLKCTQRLGDFNRHPIHEN
jgi:hypothetical protein